MAGIQIVGNSGTVGDTEANTRALKIVSIQKDVGALGAYSLAVQSATMAAGLAAGSEIFQFRWTHASNLMALRSVRVSGGTVAAWVPGFASFNMRIARSWSADGSGQSSMTFLTGDNKKRTSFGTTLAVGSGVRYSATAALGAGTKVLDGNDCAVHTFGIATGLLTSTLGQPGIPLWTRDTPDEYPFVFAQNEGFVIRATVPGTGTWTFGVQVEWSELTAV